MRLYCTYLLKIVFFVVLFAHPAAAGNRFLPPAIRAVTVRGFMPAEGQGNMDERFCARIDGCAVFLDGNGMTVVIDEDNSEKMRDAHAIRCRFMEANGCARLRGVDLLPGRINYFTGRDPSRWRTDVPSYAGVRIEGVYNGVDVVCRLDGDHLKKDYIVHSGADPGTIRIAWEGASGLSITAGGDLEISTPAGMIVERKPVAWQVVDGLKKEVDVSFRIINGDPSGIGFSVGPYDTAGSLIIDPELVFSTFLGGKNYDRVVGTAVGDDGCIYVTGNAESVDFPVTAGAYDTDPYNPEFHRNTIFVSRLDPTGSSLVYSTYISEISSSKGIAVDHDGNAYIVTTIDEKDAFPFISGAFDSTANPVGYDALIVKLSPSGNALLYTTLLGGSSSEEFEFGSILVNDRGEAIVVGTTYSYDFPLTPGAYNTDFGDHRKNVFVTRLNSDGSGLVYSTLIWGSKSEYIEDCVIDSESNIYIVGSSSAGDFPVTENCLNSTHTGNYICKLDSSGSDLVFATYPLPESNIHSVTVDHDGYIYLGGYCEFDFSTTPGAYTKQPGKNCLVCKLTPDGNNVVYSASIGGRTIFTGGVPNAYANCCWDLTVDDAGSVYILGITNTIDFPVTPDALSSTYNGGDQDLFFCVLNPSGSEVRYSTYLGGSKEEMYGSIILDTDRNIVISGYTDSKDFPSTVGAFGRSKSSYDDIFICKFSPIGGPSDVSVEPKGFFIHQPYPNPFNASTTIPFTIPSPGFTTIVIYDALGQRIRELTAENLAAGAHTLIWDGRNDKGDMVSSGLYFARLSSENLISTVRMLLLK